MEAKEKAKKKNGGEEYRKRREEEQWQLDLKACDSKPCPIY